MVNAFRMCFPAATTQPEARSSSGARTNTAARSTPLIERFGWAVDNFEFVGEARGRAVFRSVAHRLFVRHDSRGRERRASAESTSRGGPVRLDSPSSRPRYSSPFAMQMAMCASITA